MAIIFFSSFYFNLNNLASQILLLASAKERNQTVISFLYNCNIAAISLLHYCWFAVRSVRKDWLSKSHHFLRLRLQNFEIYSDFAWGHISRDIKIKWHHRFFCHPMLTFQNGNRVCDWKFNYKQVLWCKERVQFQYRVPIWRNIVSVVPRFLSFISI